MNRHKQQTRRKNQTEANLKKEMKGSYQMKKMKKVCAVLCAVLSVLLLTSAFAGEDNGLVLNGGTPATGNVHWKTIVGNITVSNNDPVRGIPPRPPPSSTLSARAT